MPRYITLRNREKHSTTVLPVVRYIYPNLINANFCQYQSECEVLGNLFPRFFNIEIAEIVKNAVLHLNLSGDIHLKITGCSLCQSLTEYQLLWNSEHRFFSLYLNCYLIFVFRKHFITFVRENTENSKMKETIRFYKHMPNYISLSAIKYCNQGKTLWPPCIYNICGRKYQVFTFFL